MADMEKEGYITTVNPMLSTDTVHGNTGHTNHDSNGSSQRRSSQMLGKTFSSMIGGMAHQLDAAWNVCVFVFRNTVLRCRER